MVTEIKENTSIIEKKTLKMKLNWDGFLEQEVLVMCRKGFHQEKAERKAPEEKMELRKKLLDLA